MIANELLRNEHSHVQFLREALGDDAVPMPQINSEALPDVHCSCRWSLHARALLSRSQFGCLPGC